MSSENDKNETSRFLGEGMSFKAKLIGILEVSEARGDRMCQEALSDLKIAIRAAGEHKQRIIINVAIDGLRLRDEKTGDSLYHHPVHKISFIAQDMTDSRAFGYIFGSPDTGHRFFGIKTDKAASQVVIAMRDLFQVVFALKKKEIELAKQNLEKNYCFNRDNSNVITESLAADSRDNSSCTSGAKNSSVLKSHGAENKPNTPVVANLVDLEIELTNLQQGISQIERLTPSDPFNSNDPFGDSFISYTPKPILPPPPGRERTCRVADTAGNTSSKAQAMTVGKGPPQMLSSLLQTSDELTPIKSHNESNDETIAGDWFISSVSGGPGTIKDPLTQSPLQKDLSSTLQSETPKKQDNISKQFDVFTELDPLGTGKIKPYIHKRDFFQDLKKPKKVLNDLVNDKQSYSSNTSSCPTNINEKIKSESLGFAADPFGEDPFVKSDSYSFGKDNFNVDFAILEKEQEASGFVDDMSCLTFPDLNEDSFVTTLGLESNLENDIKPQSELDSEDYRKVSPNSDNVPKPPPRPINNSLTQPPPLPPKKQPGDLCMKPPPRPPHSDDSHYDIIPKESEKDLTFSENRPPLPAPARKAKPAQFSFQQQKKKISIESSEDDYLTPIAFPPPKEFSFAEKKCFLHKSSTDDVSTNTSFQNLETPDRERWSILRNSSNMSLTDINFMLSQLTLSGLNELATELNIPLVELSNMTLAQITNYLSGIIKSRSSQNDYDSKQQDDSDTSKTNFDFADFSNFNANETTHDKYAVFRELEATEFIKVNEDDSNTSPAGKNKSVAFFSQDSTEDKYAALREITTDVGNKKLESESEKLNDEANDLIFEESLECLSEKLDETRKESGKKLDVSQSIENQEKQKLIVSHSHNKKTISQSSSDDKRESPKQFERSIDDVFEEEKQLQTFDSISEGASGTSPENEAAPEGIRVNRSDKEWTVFDQTKPQVGEKLSLQSEEGVSPWSSDSKEFGNSSPPEWKQTVDSGSERWGKRASQSLKDEEKWWDTSAEPDEYYEPNRRSIDSFEDEYCTYSKTLPGTKNKKKQITGASPGSQAAGGHSSSSRDISPWEEETYTLTPSQRKNVRSSENWERHSRQYFEKCRDSWDEEDDYEYDEEQYGRYYWPDRHGSRPLEKVGYSRRMKEHWANERHLWKQELERKRHCCEDWELGNAGKNNRYYGVNKRSNEGVCSHKWTGNYDDPHFLRDSQDSSWEEDYRQNSPEMQSSHYINLKHRWKRPSSASEVEKNTDEIRNKQVQYYVGITGGSDGEKERRYKANRRSRSRDAHCCDVNAHYKQDPNFTLRNHHKSRMHPQHNAPFNGNNQEMMYSNKSDDFSNKQTSGSRKKVRDDAKPNNFNAPPPPTSNVNVSWKFENNFIDSNESPPLPPPAHAVKYTFDYEQNNTGINKPPPLRRPTKINKPKNQNIRGISGNNSKNNRRFTYQSADQSIVVSRRTQRSPFEDDFSPPPPPPPATAAAAAAAAAAPSPSAISNQSEPTENDLKNEEQDYFSPEISDKKSAMTKIITNSNRLGNFSSDDGLKKSESVNIFVRENDPFDDDFFSENALDNFSDYAKSPKNNR